MNATPPNLADLRREYTRDGLDEANAPATPMPLFQRWFEQARLAGLSEPNAMTLATASPNGLPDARIVLCKGIEPDAILFFTNYQSAKARQLDANPSACCVFFWEPLERQVRLRGTVQKTTPDESAAYFQTRPIDSQLGAWASQQSEPIANRAELEASVAQTVARFANGMIPTPPFWGGYRLWILEAEFWQGRRSRLHDRLLYRRDNPTSDQWHRQRLSP